MQQNSNKSNSYIRFNEAMIKGQISADLLNETWLQVWKGDPWTYDSDSNNFISGTNDGQEIANINNGKINLLIPKSVKEPNTSNKKKDKKITNNEGSSMKVTNKKPLLEKEEIKSGIKEIGKKSRDEILSENLQNNPQANGLQTKQESLDKVKKNLINKNGEEQEKMDLSKSKNESPEITFNSDCKCIEDNVIIDFREEHPDETASKTKEKVDKVLSNNIISLGKNGYSPGQQLFFDYLFKTLLSAILSLVNFTNKVFRLESNDNDTYKLKNICEEKNFAITFDNYKKILEGNVHDIYVGEFWEVYDQKERSIKNNEKCFEKMKEYKSIKYESFGMLFETEIKEIYKKYLKNEQVSYCDNCKINISMKTIKDFKKFKNYKEELNKKIIEFIDTEKFPIIDDNILEINEGVEEEINNSDCDYDNNTIKPDFNIRRKIMKRCYNVIDINISHLCKKYKSDFVYVKNVFKIQIGQSFESYREFANKYLCEIFVKEYNEVQSIINSENKILKELFKETKFIDVLKSFLFDENIIKITNEKGEIQEIKFDHWLTYEDFFNYEYTKEQNNAYRKDLMDIMNKKKKMEKDTKGEKDIKEENLNKGKKGKKSKKYKKVKSKKEENKEKNSFIGKKRK